MTEICFFWHENECRVINIARAHRKLFMYVLYRLEGQGQVVLESGVCSTTASKIQS